MKPVENAHLFYKLWSFWGILLLTVLPVITDNADVIVQQVPPEWQSWAQIVVGILTVIARLTKQKGV